MVGDILTVVAIHHNWRGEIERRATAAAERPRPLLDVALLLLLWAERNPMPG